MYRTLITNRRSHRNAASSHSSVSLPASQLRRLIPTAARALRTAIETLEARTLFSQNFQLLGVEPQFQPPIINAQEIVDPTDAFPDDAALDYNAGASLLTVDATPTTIKLTQDGPVAFFQDPRDFKITLSVNNSGQLVGTGTPTDLLISGTVDANSNGIIEANETGVLLTGKIIGFGSFNTSETIGATDNYDFRFQLTGGGLASYFTGHDIGVAITSIASTFNDTYTSNFSGDVQAVVAVIGPNTTPPPGPISVDKQGPVFAKAGDCLTYTYYVTNNTTSAISNVKVWDDKSGSTQYVSGDTNHNNKLDPTEKWKFTDTYQPCWKYDICITNTATATGSIGGQSNGCGGWTGGTAVSATDSYTIHSVQFNKALWLYYNGGNGNVAYNANSSNGSSCYDNYHSSWWGGCGFDDDGQDHHYGCNYGSGSSGNNTPFTVQVLQGGKVVGTFTVTPSNPAKIWLGEGNFTFREINLPAGYENVTGNINYTATCDAAPSLTMKNVIHYDLSVEKTGPAFATPGQTITYNYNVTNTGPAQVKPTLLDNVTGMPTYVSGDTDHDGRVDIGEVWKFTSTYKIPANAGIGSIITNTATVDDAGNPHKPGQYGGDSNTADNMDSWSVQVVQNNANASLDGFVWEDFNGDGSIDFNEDPIACVVLKLTGTNDLGQSVSLQTTTDSRGYYKFNNLRAGTYTIAETQPNGYDDGEDVVGTLGAGSRLSGDIIPTGTDVFSGIVVGSGQSGLNYNFGELPRDGKLGCNTTATIGFWQNKNGQNLIKALNGGASATQLGNWLAATFPNMYGAASGAGNSLAGKTNAQIASIYVGSRFFSESGMKIDAQVFATALAVYVTNRDLAGTVAQQYGFTTSDNGTGAQTFNVGNNGAAFGFANNSTHTVMQYLLATNDRAYQGVLWDTDHNGSISQTEQSLRSMGNTLFTAINEGGDIS